MVRIGTMLDPQATLRRIEGLNHLIVAQQDAIDRLLQAGTDTSLSAVITSLNQSISTEVDALRSAMKGMDTGPAASEWASHVRKMAFMDAAAHLRAAAQLAVLIDGRIAYTLLLHSVLIETMDETVKLDA